MTDNPPRPAPVKPPDTEQKKQEDKAPKKDKAPKRSPGRPTKQAQMEESLNELFLGLAAPFAIVGDFHCATIITNGAPQLAKSWSELAQQNKVVKSFIESMMGGSAWMGVIMSTAAVTIPVMQHHGAYPQNWPNPFNPIDIMERAMNDESSTANGNGANSN